MAINLDFTTDINNVTRQINQYIVRNQPIPKCTLEYYNTLVSATINNNTLDSGGSEAGVGLPPGSLNTTFSTVGTTNTVILAANPSTTYVFLQNVGDSSIYLNFGAVATINGGLLLLPGASWISQIPQFIKVDINAIADGSASDVAVYSIA